MQIASVKSMHKGMPTRDAPVTATVDLERRLLKALSDAGGPIAPRALIAEVIAISGRSEAQVREAAEDLLARGCIVVTDDWKLVAHPHEHHVIA